MGIFRPVSSAVEEKLIPDPPPEANLSSVAACGTDSDIRAMQRLMKKIGAEKNYLDNGMYSYFKKLEKGERVIFDDSLPIYPPGVAINLTAIHAIQCAMVLKPHVLIVTDLPVPKPKAPFDAGDEELNFMLVTYHNLIRAKEIIMLRQKYCPDVEIYYTFQGYNLQQLERIMTELAGFQFDGFCLATRALPWRKLTGMMIMMYQFGVRKIHILAGSNLSAMTVGAFLARHLFDEVSYDSHNWLFFSLKDSYRIFGSMGAARATKKVEVPQHILALTCDCPHCQGRSLYNIREMEHGQEKQHLLAKHNFFIEVETAKELYAHSETPDMLIDFLLSKSNRTKLIIEMHEALSGIYEMKEYLGDYQFARGLAEYVFQRFKAR